MSKTPTGETLKEVQTGKRTEIVLERYRYVPGKNWYNFGYIEEVPFDILFTDHSHSPYFPDIIAKYDGRLYYLRHYSKAKELHSSRETFEVREEYLTYRKERERRVRLEFYNEQRILFIKEYLDYYKEVVKDSKYSVCGVELDLEGNFTYHYEGKKIPLIKYSPARVRTIHDGPLHLGVDRPRIEFSDYSSALHDAVKWVYKEIEKLHKQEETTVEQAFEAYKQCKK